jgi:dihydroorotate dehydrogenase (NAD+) catalytic subunit
MTSTPFYDAGKSYDENYTEGPFGIFAEKEKIERKGEPRYEFLGKKVYLPFGIPAGPLLNSKFTSGAFRNGFDIAVYKTVRTRSYPCHPWPNVLAVHIEKDLTLEMASKPLVADTNYTQPLSITNSFGVPSKEVEIWQEDMKVAVAAQGKGQVLVGSFQGTSDGSGDVEKYVDDFVLAARLVKETGAAILEANLSCPNEGTAHLLCFDLERTALIARKIKEEIGDTPLILKMAYFPDQEMLRTFVKTVGNVVQGLSAINTIAAPIVDKEGNQALPGKGRERSGVCGSGITWAGVEMAQRLKALREELNMKYAIIGVGGVVTPEDYFTYREAGADAVMSATGAMWNPHLAKEIYERDNS